MAFNFDKAFEVDEDGYSITDNDGNVLAYLCAGSGDPSGSSAPINTWYFRTDNNLQYYKFGAGDNDWRQLRANDIAFDVSSLTADSPDLSGLIQLQQVVSALANRNFGKEVLYDEVSTFETALSNFQSVLVFSSIKPAGTYRIAWSFTTTNSKSNTTNITQAIFNNVQVYQRVQIGSTINSVGGFKGDLVHPGGALNYSIETRVSAGNGLAQLSEIRAELWRVS